MLIIWFELGLLMAILFTIARGLVGEITQLCDDGALLDSRLLQAVLSCAQKQRKGEGNSQQGHGRKSNSHRARRRKLSTP